MTRLDHTHVLFAFHQYKASAPERLINLLRKMERGERDYDETVASLMRDVHHAADARRTGHLDLPGRKLGKTL
jgi:hypothetical protein